MLPAQQEAHEIPSADRLDLASQTLLRVEMDAGEQAARAEFRGRAVPGVALLEPAAKGEALPS
jgi:hypothetical protein